MRRRVVAAGAVAVAAVVAVSAGVAASGGTPPAAVPAPQPVSAVSACGLPGTPADSTEGATAATWQAVGAYMLPVSATDGPGTRVQSGPWSCFTRTESGAVLAGLTISLRASGVAENWHDVITAQTLPGAGQDAALAAPLGPAEQVTVRGFQVAAYTEDRATIRYYLHSPSIDASCTEDVAWSAGDWRLVLGDDGSTSSGCTQGAPATFTPWGP